MKNKSGVNSKEFGLGAGVVLSRYFLKTDHLHFGYWPDDLPVDIDNVRHAQDRYCDILISNIPDSTRSILDVGCGTGVLSRRLKEEGYEVESLSPSPFLTSLARENLGEESIIHECTFEDLELDRKFDIILFAESLQYIELEKVFTKCRDMLTENGSILVFDFFKKDNPTKGIRIGGGHPLGAFYMNLEKHGYSITSDTDLTSQIALSMDVVADLVENFVKPLWELFLYGLESNYPRFTRFAMWRYRKKIMKIERQILAGHWSAQAFASVKSYRLVLCKPPSDDDLIEN